MTYILELTKGKGKAIQKRYCTCNNVYSIDDAFNQANSMLMQGWEVSSWAEYPDLQTALEAVNLSVSKNSVTKETKRLKPQAKRIPLSEIALQRFQQLRSCCS